VELIKPEFDSASANQIILPETFRVIWRVLGYPSVSPKPPSPTDTILRQRPLLNFRLPEIGVPILGA
jgi:hypothetical protein